MPKSPQQQTPRRSRSAPHPILHKLGFMHISNPKLVGRDAYALAVTPSTLAGLGNLATLMQDSARRFAPDPALKRQICILVHRAPKQLDDVGWTQFSKQHRIRVEKQFEILHAKTPMTNACIKHVIASPIVAGAVRVGSLRAYITCIEIDQGASFSTPRTRIGHMEYAAIEQAVVMSWLAGVEHTVMGPIVLNSSFEASLVDFSGIVKMPKWKYNMVRGGNYAKVLGTSVAADTADARFLRKLYGALQPVSDPVGRAALVEKARQGVWKCAQSIS